MEDYGSIFTGVTVGVLLVLFALIIAFVVFDIIIYVKLYKKMGLKGWECIIPIYSTWCLVKCAGMSTVWFVISAFGSVILSFLPSSIQWIGSLALIFVNFNIYYNISKRFKQDTGFAILLTIVPIVGVAMLAFGKNYSFDSNISVGENGYLDRDKANNNSNSSNNTGSKFCAYCGSKLDNGSTFCGKCGHKVDE